MYNTVTNTDIRGRVEEMISRLSDMYANICGYHLLIQEPTIWTNV